MSELQEEPRLAFGFFEEVTKISRSRKWWRWWYGHLFRARRLNIEGPGLGGNPDYQEDELNLNF